MRVAGSLVVAALILVACSKPAADPAAPIAGARPTTTTDTAAPAPTTTEAAPPPTAVPNRASHDSAELAVQINAAVSIIHDPAAPAGQLEAAGRLEQLCFGRVATTDGLADQVMPRLTPQAQDSLAGFLRASNALAGLAEKPDTLPPWQILAPDPIDTLIADYREAESLSGIPWPYFASINFIESRLGRIRGPSSAGAMGPMQFEPSTWEEYGAGGDINNTHDAVLGAARLLMANGGPADMDNAIFHYNADRGYVAAVRTYAERIAADEREFYGYYQWQVIYTYVAGTVILPVGYPATAPVAID
jgi:hypothetical protein